MFRVLYVPLPPHLFLCQIVLQSGACRSDLHRVCCDDCVRFEDFVYRPSIDSWVLVLICRYSAFGNFRSCRRRSVRARCPSRGGCGTSRVQVFCGCFALPMRGPHGTVQVWCSLLPRVGCVVTLSQSGPFLIRKACVVGSAVQRNCAACPVSDSCWITSWRNFLIVASVTSGGNPDAGETGVWVTRCYAFMWPREVSTFPRSKCIFCFFPSQSRPRLGSSVASSAMEPQIRVFLRIYRQPSLLHCGFPSCMVVLVFVVNTQGEPVRDLQ